jgi:ubiquinone/menaquinone biosynthesis C-methylase UbiE
MQKTNDSYFIATGSADRERLAILNRLYNPVTLQFLQQNGLKPGMTVLEIGCGMGAMACCLANVVGPAGKVIATDNSAQQLEIAKQTARDAQVNNIEFKELDVRSLTTLTEKVDLVYGRWVLEFTGDAEACFRKMHEVLKPGGILTYETASFVDNAHFSYPQQAVVDQWFGLSITNFRVLHLEPDFGNRLYHLTKQLQCGSIAFKTHQPILMTAEEKSVLRLASMNVRETMLNHKVLTPENYEQLLEELRKVEQDDVIIGFFRNFLVAGVKQ